MLSCRPGNRTYTYPLWWLGVPTKDLMEVRHCLETAIGRCSVVHIALGDQALSIAKYLVQAPRHLRFVVRTQSLHCQHGPSCMGASPMTVSEDCKNLANTCYSHCNRRQLHYPNDSPMHRGLELVQARNDQDGVDATVTMSAVLEHHNERCQSSRQCSRKSSEHLHFSAAPALSMWRVIIG